MTTKLSAAVFTMGMILMLLPVLVFTQGYNGSISGTVKDPTGAVVPGAEVTLTAVSTAVELHSRSNVYGLYSFPNVVPGPYSLRVAARGFRDYVQEGIVIAMNSKVRADVRLVVGAAAQTVQVSANASPLSYQGPMIKHSISPQVVQDLPLQFSGGVRSAADFVILVPGVSTGGQANPYEARINGGLQGGSEAVLDGVTMQEGLLGFSGTISFYNDIPVSPAAVSELSVLTSTFDPKYGNTTAGVITGVTKSGTGQFHGSVYEFFRNTSLNARQFGTTTRPIDHESDFGAYLGGPMHFPLFWSGNKKSYFFVNFEGYRSSGAVSEPVLSVPTVQERSGDFSDWKTSGGTLIPIYNPSTTALNPGYNPGLPAGPSNEPVLRQQFAGNVIPSAMLTGSLASGWLKWVPAPNLPGLVSNYLPPGVVAKNASNSWDVRGDQYYKDKDHFSVIVHYRGTLPSPATYFPPQISSQGYRAPNYSFVDRASWDHTFSPTKLNNFNVGYLDLWTQEVNIADKYVADVPQIAGVAHEQEPIITFQNFSQYGYNANFAQTRPNFVLNDTFTWVRGTHTLEFGAEYRNERLDNKSNTANDSGTFNFAASETGLPGVQSGSDMASFLLGAVNTANAEYYGNFGSNYAQAEDSGLFFGDNWKATSRLTITYGLRWDLNPPSVEKYNRLSFLDPTRSNPSAGGLPGALVFAGTGWGPASFGARHPEQTFYHGFGPRLGVAYTMTPKTVVRTGYGIFFDQNFYPGFNGGITNSGFTTNPAFSSPDGGVTPAFYLAQEFPQNFPKPPFLNPGFDNGQSIAYRPFTANRLPYGQQWNLTVEHQFTNNFYVSTAYVGNKGTHLLSSIAPLNALNPNLLSMGQELYGTFQPGQTSLAGVNAPYTGWSQQMISCSPDVAQALLPYPQYCGNIYGLNENDGNSIYHALQITAQQRFSHGLYVLGSYTWSKLITDSNFIEPSNDVSAGLSGAISPFQRSRDRALAPDDVPAILSLSAIYNLPFGSGERFLNKSGMVDRLVGNWQLSTIFRVSSGVPFFFRSSQCNIPPQFAMGCIPGILPGANIFAQPEGSFDPGKGPLLNASAFESPSSFNFYGGNGTVETSLRAPGYRNQDIALTKNFKLTERLRLQIEGEFFNAWNWHTFTTTWLNGNPNTITAFVTNVASPNFGKWNGQVSAPRNIQLAAQFIF